MLQFLIAIAAFLVALGLLVSIHELGHYWVARWVGVRVLRYSIGFGKKLVGWTSPGTGIEYQLAAIPLGGYVKMLDEREGQVADADKPYAFNRVHPWRRMAIVAAGPLVNLIFAILAYWLVMMLGVPGVKPIVDAPPSDTPAAQAGFQSEDRVRSLAGHEVSNWQGLSLELIRARMGKQPVSVAIQGRDGQNKQLRLDMTDLPYDPDKLLSALGLEAYQPPATTYIDKVMPDSAAAQAGLQAGDAILAVNDYRIDSPRALVEAVQKNPGARVSIKIRRHDKVQRLDVALGKKQAHDGQATGQLGAALTVDAAAFEHMRTVRQLGPLAAMPAAMQKTWDLTVMSARLIGRMFIGQVSWRNVGGPVQIASYAGQSAQIGGVAFISFLGFISLNLALINLLPIPLLDGGHLLYDAVEWGRGKPLSETAQATGQRIGLMALLMLMALAFYNDILRLLG